MIKEIIAEIKRDRAAGAPFTVKPPVTPIFPVGTAKFSVGGRNYRIEINPSDNFKNGVVGIFKLLNNPNKAIYKDTGNEDADIKQFIIDKHAEQMGNVATGGNHNKILNAVINTFCNYLEDYKPDISIFHALNNRRARFYQRVMQSVAKKVEEVASYKLNYAKNTETGTTEFHLVRDDKALAESVAFFATRGTL